MKFDGGAAPNGAPVFDEAIKWLGSTTLIIAQRPPGEISYSLAGVNGEPSFVGIDYLTRRNGRLRLVSSIRNWAFAAPHGIGVQEFDRLVEHYMSVKLTLHPEIATSISEYLEPKFSTAIRQEMLIAGAASLALRIEGPGELSGFIASTIDRIVTCVWDSEWSGEPGLTRSGLSAT